MSCKGLSFSVRHNDLSCSPTTIYAYPNNRAKQRNTCKAMDVHLKRRVGLLTMSSPADFNNRMGVHIGNERTQHGFEHDDFNCGESKLKSGCLSRCLVLESSVLGLDHRSGRNGLPAFVLRCAHGPLDRRHTSRSLGENRPIPLSPI